MQIRDTRVRSSEAHLLLFECHEDMERYSRSDRELDEVIRIARTAERHVREVYETAFTVDVEAAGDPVTRADREASERVPARR